MITYEGVDRNFQFLVLEVRKQLETLFRLFEGPSEGLIRTILSRDNYTDTLKALIEKKCISYFRHTPTIDKSSANLVTAINVCTTNLERIADFSVNAAVHIQRLSDHAFLSRFNFQDYVRELLQALALMDKAVASVDSTTAIQLCRVEATVDALYKADFQKIRDALRTGRDTDDLLICLYVAHYLERMGDSLLNIGEAVLSAATGEKLKLHEYLRLHEALESQHPTKPVAAGDYKIAFNWETQSGCRIAHVHEKPADGREMEAIFKKGRADKLRREHNNIARWESVVPGVPPKVLEFRDGEEDAALLLEFLDGYTLRDFCLNGERGIVDEAVDALEQMLSSVWLATRRDGPVQAGFCDQARARLEDVFRLHPEFENACYEIGTMSVASLEELLTRAERVERMVRAPFAVLVHGDLNADNIIYNNRERALHLVDLYRSHDSDYVQDVATFVVSNFRLPVFDPHIRELLNHATLRGYRFAHDFARRHDDATFGLRLALGLARAFITSTRFEIDGAFARIMYSRAVYLLEKVSASASSEPFQVSADVLVY